MALRQGTFRDQRSYEEGRMNTKGYVHHWIVNGTAVGSKIEYSFDSSAEKVATWTSKDEADIDCRLFNRQNIQIPSALGGYHVCSDFRSEERRSGEFVIFCEAPFIRKALAGAA
jgi:hypothetical protein